MRLRRRVPHLRHNPARRTPVDSVRDCLCVDSQSSSARVRKVDRVVRWATGLRCVPASVVRCIPLAPRQRQVDVRWAVARWVDVRWASDLVCRLRVRRPVVREHVLERLHGVRDSATRLLVASKKDR